MCTESEGHGGVDITVVSMGKGTYESMQRSRRMTRMEFAQHAKCTGSDLRFSLVQFRTVDLILSVWQRDNPLRWKEQLSDHVLEF